MHKNVHHYHTWKYIVGYTLKYVTLWVHHYKIFEAKSLIVSLALRKKLAYSYKGIGYFSTKSVPQISKFSLCMDRNDYHITSVI